MPEKPFLTIEGNQKREAQLGEYPSGLHRAYVEQLSPQATTSETLATILTLNTGVIPAGNYKIDWSFLWATDNQNKQVEVVVNVDGTPIWDMLGASIASNAIRPGAGFSVVALSNAAHTITVQYRKYPGPNGTVNVDDIKLAMERWN